MPLYQTHRRQFFDSLLSLNNQQSMESINPHAAPPRDMKEVFKGYQKLKFLDGDDLNLVDFNKVDRLPEEIVVEGSLLSEQLLPIFQKFAGTECQELGAKTAILYGHKSLPGLLVIPGLLPPEIQKLMLQHLLHRDLSDPKHQTNLHLHYEVPYLGDQDEFGDGKISNPAASFFSLSPDSNVKFEPKDPQLHKSLSLSQVMQKKLRWMTLGGQYDWTNKTYPSEKPPAFPADLAALIEALFPEMKAEAAIVNLYSPGDTLSLHRDVSEECDKGLVSISLGCDCIFLAGLEQQPPEDIHGPEQSLNKCAAIRLRSGDAVYMSKEARYAWHGVPKIIAGTCPSYLEDWPASSGSQFSEWRGWMKNKRINLNVRQMYE